MQITPFFPVSERAMVSAISVASLPAACQDDRLDPIVVQADEAFGVVDDIRVQIPAVHVQRGCLLCYRSSDPRVCVAHARHVVVQIEVARAVCGLEPYAVAAHEFDGVLVKEWRVMAHRPTVPVQEFCHGASMTSEVRSHICQVWVSRTNRDGRDCHG